MLGDPYTLQEAQLGIMDSQICTMFFQGPQPGNNTYSVQDDMLCAGDLMTGKSICRVSDTGCLSSLLCVFSGTCPST